MEREKREGEREERERTKERERERDSTLWYQEFTWTCTLALVFSLLNTRSRKPFEVGKN
jgi:hypothetical protein